jgi:adenylosuccinate synthase
MYDKMYEMTLDLVLDSYAETLASVEVVSGLYLGLEKAVVFEGSQGMLLDSVHGTAPHNSWTDATFAGAYDLLKSHQSADVTRVGVIRSYATRHGAGPFLTEAPELLSLVPELHNGDHPWMGAFRVGHFNASFLGYALRSIGGVDMLALTHMDRRPSTNVATSYDHAGLPNYEPVLDLPAYLETRFGIPVGIVSRGMCYEDKEEVERGVTVGVR